MRFKVPRRQPESFRASALYLAGEIKGLSPDRVEFVEVRNLFTDNARAASSVMEATAAKSVRCKQPAYHFMITFDPKDAAAGKVTPELKRKVAQQVIERMGLTEHQLMVYSHQDTEHPHMHFLVNRIHPQKHVAYDRHQDGRRLTGIVHELAREHGLNILRNREYERQLGRDVDDLAPAISDGEYWKTRREDREALIPLGKDATADLRRRLKDDFYQSQTWAELNHRLTRKGITMERKGQGLILSDGERFAKLSDMGKGVRFNTLEERFGERFDDFMASRAAEIARDDREGQQALDTSDLEPEERRTVEGMLAGDIDTSPEGDAVRRADQADMDYRYWIQIEAAYRSRKGRVRYAEQQEVWHAKQAEREAGWITKREASFLEGLAKVYKDANKARARWDDLEKKLGIKEAEDAIRKDPFLLGAVKGVRIGDYRSRDRAEAKKSFRYIMQHRQKLRDARLKHGQAHHEIEQARRRTKAAVRDLEIIQNIAGSPAQLRKRLAAKIAARARALERLSEKALKRANLADDRKEQLERAWRLHRKRQLERERTKERGRPFGLDLDLFDD